ncbi:hypothetical protein [Hymenobacter sp. BRD67]|uniref:hypothetical protein n=1 Tax=Hymenobacter sp. BRD67 TaxID=2675877 RepID=UPI0015658ECE|nr:hypothetical protein [Hymenobacter sp. BRD67]QKG52252.1 hypothetical protein GKZ67_06015 [Hymenobacter sp. BRD67]
MRKILYAVLALIFLYAMVKDLYTGRSPEALAHRACDCWSELKLISNTTARANKADECYRVTQQAQSDLRDMGISKDWNDQQVKQAEAEFDAVYSNCTGDTGSPVSSSDSQPLPEVAHAVDTSPNAVETTSPPVESYSAPLPPHEDEPQASHTTHAFSDIFPEIERARIFNVSMNTTQATAQLVLHSDSSIVGVMVYNANSVDHSEHRITGHYNSDGTISLNEYTSSETEKELVCKLARKGDCFEGDGKNLMNDVVSVSVCLRE